jgi:hypothetical protein
LSPEGISLKSGEELLFEVQVFLYCYQVQIPKGRDAKIILEKHSVPELVEKCKDDITQRRWDILSLIIQKQ